jgi:translation initiation factor IF-2
MNNGKVRIYELSKELNLDNRDILAVCEKLNIAVKSHSSTISDAEADRIRSAAEKLPHSTAQRPSPASHNGGGHSGGNGQVKKGKSKQPPPVKKKQQILEIRRNRSLSGPPNRPGQAAETTADSSPSSGNTTTATAPARPVPRPVSPNRPTQATPEQPTAPSRLQPPRSDAPAAQAQPEPVVQPSDYLEVHPELTEVDAQNAPELQDRPVLKRPKTISPDDSSEALPSEHIDDGAVPELIEQPIKQESQKPESKASRASPETAPKPSLKPKPVIELRKKPVRPSRAKPDEEKATEEVETVETTEETKRTPELRRPTPPKSPKRGKKWEEEEEEQEIPAKSKVGAKSKRRSQPRIDEDEDIDPIDALAAEDLDDEDADEDEGATPISLSLMRPPKPKSNRPTTSRPPAPTQKKKGESGRSFRRDRREPREVKEKPTEIVLTHNLSVGELADLLAQPETEVIKTLFFKGIAANINQILDIPTATMVAEELGVEVTTAEAEAEAKKVTEMLDAEDLEHLQRRPPVVTIMGHVDHGKTTLLDSIRKTKVAQGEAGGITQHIGAYHVDVEHEGEMQQVVFLDTPGHEAFTAMRARGTRVTDIAVLVVAADDGVQPQTIEAISHAKAAGVPIVVAVNKIDKEESQPDRVKQELMEHGLVPEEWGGDTIMVSVSAIKGENLDDLLEMLLLVAEVEDLYANPDRPARGTIIEANLDKARGPVATLLIQNGTLRVGDVLVAGSVFGKVRAMIDDRGQRVDQADPSFAVEVLGLGEVPSAGDEFEVFADEKEARAVASGRADQQRQSRLQQAMASRRVSLNTLSAQAQEGELKELNLVLKADVQGSVEAILGALQQLPQKEVQLRVLLSAPGEITETDVDLAAASDAVILGFNTTFASGARQAAEDAGVDVRNYNIIYKLLEDVQGAMEGLLDPEMVEEPLGRIEVRAVFPVGKGAVAGCYVLSGKAIRNCKLRVLRGSQVVFQGNLDSLKRMKDDVKEVNAGYECGVGVDSFKDWQEGDIIETYQLVSKRRTLSA